MNEVPIVVDVYPDTQEEIAAAAAASYPRETGGLLLGWWQAGRVVARHAIEVPDPGATSNSWTRVQADAQAALDTAIGQLQHPWLGYVGDWHTHPGPCRASTQDIASIRRASRQYPEPLVLLVHGTNGTLDHVVAHKGRVRRGTLAPSTEGSASR